MGLRFVSLGVGGFGVCGEVNLFSIVGCGVMRLFDACIAVLFSGVCMV